MTKQQESLASLASSFASIAQSFREYVELYRANSDREAAKGRRPSIVSVSTATYQREQESGDVPGFRVSGKVPKQKLQDFDEHYGWDKKSTSTK